MPQWHLFTGSHVGQNMLPQSKDADKNEIKYEIKTEIKNVFPSFQSLPHVTARTLLGHRHADRSRCGLLMMLTTSQVYIAIGLRLCALHASAGEAFPSHTANLTQGWTSQNLLGHILVV